LAETERISKSVTPEQVAALRTLLARDFAEHKRLIDRIDQTGAWKGYNELISAAFFEAVYRRFAQQYTTADIIEYVAEIRTRFAHPDQGIDPDVAERLIRKALGQGTVSDIGKKALIHTEGVVLGALIMDEQMDSAELDAFIEQARELANRWLRKRSTASAK
jgi:hypothetical protein